MYINNKKINMPDAVFVKRPFNRKVFDNAKKIGLSPISAKLIANRSVPEDSESLNKIINPSFKNSNLDIYKLKDIKKSADRIADAIINKERIGLLCDFDVDGISSAAVLYSAMVDYFHVENTNIDMLISHRMMYGYGFREEILNDILSMHDKPTLLITADQGSSDEERILKYNQEMEKLGYDKHDVIVTDHHHIKENGPISAYAVINPQQKQCEFDDKTICGCTVALFTMVATRDSLIEKGYLEPSAPKLTNLITYSTAATIADCVSMASPLNRAIVKKGLFDISQEIIPAWTVMKNKIVGTDRIVDANSIGFGLGPRINACSRTGGDGLVALKFFLSETVDDALRYLNLLETMNEDRKEIEKKLVEDALIQSSDLYMKGYKSLVIYLPNGHHGIHGIAASKVSEKFGRPVIIFSPKTYEETDTKDKKSKSKKIKVITVSGSGRSIEGVDLYEALDNCSKKDPNLFLGFGGHSMAAGMAINLSDFNKFREMFEEEIQKMIPEPPYPKILIDGEITNKLNIDFNLLDEVKALEPYGNGFEEPIFKARVYIKSTRIVGQNKDTLKIDFIHNGYNYTGMIFRYSQHPMYQNIFNERVYDIAFSLNESYYKGNRQLNLFVKHLISVD